MSRSVTRLGGGNFFVVPPPFLVCGVVTVQDPVEAIFLHFHFGRGQGAGGSFLPFLLPFYGARALRPALLDNDLEPE